MNLNRAKELLKKGRPRRLADWVGVILILISLTTPIPKLTLGPLISRLKFSTTLFSTGEVFLTVSPTQGGGLPTIGTWFGCEKPDGDVEYYKYDSEMRLLLPGPHRRTIALLALTHDVRHAVRDKLPHVPAEDTLKILFCTRKYLPEGIVCAPGSRSWRMRWLGPTQSGVPRWHERTIPCSG